jgi:predicted nucleotidyltransferase
MRKLDDTDFAALTAVLREAPDLLAGYCFGSQAAPERRAPRDLDIAVLGAEPLGLMRLLELRAVLTGAIRSDALDLVDLRRATPVLRRQVIKSGHMLFARDLSFLNRFELDALREYQDSDYRRRVQLHYLSQGRASP